MKLRLRLSIWLLPLFVFSALALSDQAKHLRLIEPLDRPQDGYCVDVVGTPGSLRKDLPLFAHNCKPRLTIDSAVVFDPNGHIRFKDLDLCMTVAGINSVALPGTSVVLHQCGVNSVFFDTAELQTFNLQDNGKLILKNTNLCLAVGSQSATTYSTADKWRTLFVEDCSVADPAQSRWVFSDPE